VNAHEEIKLGPLGVFAGCVIDKGTIQRHALELPLDMLIDRTDPDIADPLSNHSRFLPKCQGRLHHLFVAVSRNSKQDFILTVAGLGGVQFI
jgi:hypothetical protein